MFILENLSFKILSTTRSRVSTMVTSVRQLLIHSLFPVGTLKMAVAFVLPELF